MDIKILDSWLREYIETNAKPADIAKCLSLCGPSIEKIEKVSINKKPDHLYHIEVTTNRVDLMSIWGIAREAAVILPQFGFSAKLISPKLDDGKKYAKKDVPVKFVTDGKLVQRMMGVILEIDKLTPSDQQTTDRLEATGIRSLNNIVDVTNYVMTEIGHPSHVFDYDLVKPVLKVRESKKDEEVQSFDGKSHKLPGGDIVFENEEGDIIDLPGIIGTKNSVVNEDTKRILFFIDTNSPTHIRKTSMKLAIRTVAATLNEKGVDPNLAEIALKRGIYLYKKLSGVNQISAIIDNYPNKLVSKQINLSHELLVKKLGIEIESKKVIEILGKLDIKTSYNVKENSYTSVVPSLRVKDIEIPEDLIEEVARIYGYHNLPSELMDGNLPKQSSNHRLVFENNLKDILKNLGGIEIYTLSLVSKDFISGNALRVKNPLGPETEYLRNSLMPSLIEALNLNVKWLPQFHIYEVANVYIEKKGDLPEEKMVLGGAIYNENYRAAKGIVEALLENLHIEYNFKDASEDEFIPGRLLQIISVGKIIGKFGEYSRGKYYYEFSTTDLFEIHKEHGNYIEIPKFPPQIEDTTLILPERTQVGEVYESIKKHDKYITNAELKDTYKDAYTFRIWYQSEEKTLDNSEVEKIRNSLISQLHKKFGAVVK